MTEPTASAEERRLPGAWAAAGTLAASFGGQALTIVTSVVLARALGPRGRGELTAITFWAALMATLFVFGVSTPLSRAAGAAPGALGAVRAQALRVSALLSALAVACGWFALPALLQDVSPELEAIAGWYFAVLAPLMIVSAALLAIEQGAGNFLLLNRARLSIFAVYLVGSAAFWASGSTRVQDYLLAHALANAAVVLQLWPGLPWSSSEAPPVSELLRRGLSFWVADLLGLAYANAERLVGVTVLAAEALGQYTIALTASGVVQVVARAAGQVVFARACQQAPHEALRDATRFVCAALAACAALASVLLVAIPELVPLVFGAPFAAAAAPARHLLVGQVVGAVGIVLDECLRGVGRARPGALAKVLGMVVLAAAYGRIEGGGPMAVAGAAVLGQASYTALLLVAFVHARAATGRTPAAVTRASLGPEVQP